ncbi:MAG: M16 family metallopeptidase, partial [Myxococcota bacterium]
VGVQLIVRGGGAQEPQREAGLATLTFDMLDEGAGSLDALGLAEAIANLGTRAQVWSGREAGGVGMGVLKRHVDESVSLLASMAQKPRFTTEDFERVKERHLSSIKGRTGDPRSVAGDVFAAATYGEKHAYGRPTVGTEETVQRLKVSQAKKFWGDIAGPKTAALVFAGDITLEEAVALAERHFGKWRGKATPPKAPSDPKPLDATRLRLVDFPGAPQTVMMIGRPLVKQGDEDEPALLVFNQVLGGMFSSRLNLNLREDKGWTYGASTSVDARSGLGPFIATAGIKTEHTAEAIAEVFKEFDTLRDLGIKSDEELNAAKANFIKSLPGRFETVADLLALGGQLYTYGLPLDHYTQLPERVAAVTADDVKRAAARALVRQQMAIVLVGDRAAVEESVSRLELGALQVVDAQGDIVQP